MNHIFSSMCTPDLADLDTPACVARRTAAPAERERVRMKIDLRRLLAVTLQRSNISVETAASVMKLIEADGAGDRNGSDDEI